MFDSMPLLPFPLPSPSLSLPLPPPPHPHPQPSSCFASFTCKLEPEGQRTITVYTMSKADQKHQLSATAIDFPSPKKLMPCISALILQCLWLRLQLRVHKCLNTQVVHIPHHTCCGDHMGDARWGRIVAGKAYNSSSQGRILEVVFSRSYPYINKFDLQHIMASQVPSPGRNLLDLTSLRYDPPPPPPPVLAWAPAKRAYEPVFRRLPPYAAGGVSLSFVECRP